MARGKDGLRAATGSLRARLGLLMLMVAIVAFCGAVVLVPATAAAAGCPNEALRAQDKSAALPDCRAYEQVSPSYKEGYRFALDAASPGGEAITGSSLGAFAGTQQDSNLEGAYYRITRRSGGWGAEALEPPAQTTNCKNELQPACVATSSTEGNASLWVYGTASEPRGTIYRREADGVFVAIGPIQPTDEVRAGEAGPGLIVGASANLSTVVFRSGEARDPRKQELWPGDETIDEREHGSLYIYTGAGNPYPQLVGVRGAEASAISGNAQLISQCGTELGSGVDGSEFNAVSSDGSVVFFTAGHGPCNGYYGETGSGPEVNEVWARVNGTESVPISEPNEAQCAACQTAHTTAVVREEPAEFKGASEDGSRVFFSTEQELLPGAGGNNLYEYDFSAPAGDKVRLVTPAANQPAELDGVVRIAPDGQRVYYVAGGVLAGNTNSEGATAKHEADNLYVYDGETGASTFVATVWSEEDREAAEARCEMTSSESLADRCYDNAAEVPDLWQNEDDRRAVTTEDGQFLVFDTAADIVAEDTATAPQTFEYDAADGELTRASRGAENTFNNDGNSVLAGGEISRHDYTNALPGSEDANLSFVSANGTEVFFESGDALTPGALDEDNVAGCSYEENSKCVYYNAAVFAPNVYEYESPPGRIDDGSVSLIAAATTAVESSGEKSADKLYGTDASGNNVFFTTTAALVGQDTDTQGDVYDARVDGGFPAPTAPLTCTGEACQGTLAAAPLSPTPLSSSHPGGENLTPSTKKTTTSTSKVKITKHKVNGTTITLTVKAPAKGKLTASGTGVKAKTKTFKRGGKYTLTLTLTKTERKKLERKGKLTLTLTLTVSFKPSSGKSSKASAKVTLHEKHATTKKRSRSTKGSGRTDK